MKVTHRDLLQWGPKTKNMKIILFLLFLIPAAAYSQMDTTRATFEYFKMGTGPQNIFGFKVKERGAPDSTARFYLPNWNLVGEKIQWKHPREYPYHKSKS